MGISKEERNKQIRDRLGLCFITKYGESFVIIKYESIKEVKIKFQNGYEKNTRWGEIIKDEISTPYSKTVCGIGYLGEGKYTGKKYPKIYQQWHSMIQRCYDPYHLNKRPTYIDCFVCEEWHNFQNFAKWWDEHVYNCNNEKMCLDKDILIKGNKIYSPETCSIVPEKINLLFIKSDKRRGKYPIGVVIYYDKRCSCKCLVAHCNYNKKSKTLGYFPIDKPFQAFTCYKNFKENYIKQVADEYKDLIPKKLYDAMYNYQVEITD